MSTDSGSAVPSSPLFDPARDVVTEAAALQGLAHPLRLQLLGRLRSGGPSTSSRLATALGVSSGLASYHLRQLAGAGFIVDAEAADLRGIERGGARERWWKAARRSTIVTSPAAGDEEGVAATTDYLAAVLAANFSTARRWLDVAPDWPQQWQDVTNFSDVPLSLTAAQTRQLAVEWDAVLARYPRHDPAVPAAEGAVMVSLQYQVFPSPVQPPPAQAPHGTTPAG